ncbi:MAG TPA: thiol peroxidase [Desulfobulbaceae bacterium]|nr:thiol peroxidase [Desulfobulbaceae bacterium]
MAHLTLQGSPIRTVGELPAINSQAPPFTLTRTDLSDCTLADFIGQTKVLNIFLSLDTSICAASVRRFNAEASGLPNTVVLCVSADLPFAQKRFCEVEGLERVIPLSVFRSPDFGKLYGVTIVDGPLAGLLARSIVIINPAGTVTYTEQVPEISQEPDYEAALQALAK